MTHRATWKRRERDAARLFGAERSILSGSSGRGDRTRSDSTHERLFVETKLRAGSAVRTLWERTRGVARAENKTPVLVLYAKGKPGGLIVVHESDLATVAAELAANSAPDPQRGERHNRRLMEENFSELLASLTLTGPTDDDGRGGPIDDNTKGDTA